MRKIPTIANLLKRLDDVITKQFIPSITGGIKCSNVERKLLSLLRRTGSLRIPIFSKIPDFEYVNSRIVSETLTRKIINPERHYEQDSWIKGTKNFITRIRQQCHNNILKKKKRIIWTSTAIKQHKPRIWSLSLDIIFTARQQRLCNHKAAILGSYTNLLWVETSVSHRHMCLQVKI